MASIIRPATFGLPVSRTRFRLSTMNWPDRAILAVRVPAIASEIRVASAPPSIAFSA